MIDTTIKRYEVNEHGELPVSYGRYVRWEDVSHLIQEMSQRIDNLEDDLASAESPCCSFDAGYQEGYVNGTNEGVKKGMLQAAEIITKSAA